MYYEENFREILDSETLSKEDKLEFINEYFEKNNKEISRELAIYLTKIWSGFALEIGSAVIPGAGVGKIGAKVGQEYLVKSLGRKISKELGAGAVSGATSGLVFGTGDALVEDKNLLGTVGEATEGLVGGAVGGAVLGGIAAYAEKFLRGVNLKSYGNPDKLYNDIWRKYKKDMKKYYQDYIQERNIDKNGTINFTGKAIQEQMTYNIKQGQNYPDLISDIKKAKRLPDAPNLKPHEKPFVDYYEVYKGKYGYHHIEVLKDGQRRYYVTKDTLNGTHRNPPGSNKSATDIAAGTPQEANNPVNNGVYSPRALETSEQIINDFSENVNSYDGSNVLKGYVEENVYKDETHLNKEQGQPAGYAANLAANNSERELLEQLKNNSIADIGIADKIRNEGKILEKFINNQVKNNSQSAKPLTQEKLEICQRLKKERGHGEVINSNEFSWEQILKDTLEFPNAMRDFCYPSEGSYLGKSSEINTNISDIMKNEYYTPLQKDEKPKRTHGRYLNSAHEEEIERVVSKIFDSVARDMGYSK